MGLPIFSSKTVVVLVFTSISIAVVASACSRQNRAPEPVSSVHQPLHQSSATREERKKLMPRIEPTVWAVKGDVKVKGATFSSRNVCAPHQSSGNQAQIWARKKVRGIPAGDVEVSERVKRKPRVPLPFGVPRQGHLFVPAGEEKILMEGDYRYRSLTVEEGASLRIWGPYARIWVDGDITIDGRVLAFNRRPEHLWLISSKPRARIEASSNAEVHASLLAPKSRVRVFGDWSGKIVGSQVRLGVKADPLLVTEDEGPRSVCSTQNQLCRTPNTLDFDLSADIQCDAFGPFDQIGVFSAYEAAGRFAYNNFWSLVWPANNPTLQRGVPQYSGKPGDTDQNDFYVKQPVWDTFKEKRQLFTARFTSQDLYNEPGFEWDPFGASAWSTIESTVNSPQDPNGIPACSSTSFAPLLTDRILDYADETDEISLAVVWRNDITNSGENSNNILPDEKNLVRYQVKMNENFYTHLQSQNVESFGFTTGPGCRGGMTPTTIKTGLFSNCTVSPFIDAQRMAQANLFNIFQLPSGSTQRAETGTILVKTAWTLVPDNELSQFKDDYYVTPALSYRETAGGVGLCWEMDNYALIAMHIIRKTELSPYFFYSTFGHVNTVNNAGNPNNREPRFNFANAVSREKDLTQTNGGAAARCQQDTTAPIECLVGDSSYGPQCVNRPGGVAAFCQAPTLPNYYEDKYSTANNDKVLGLEEGLLGTPHQVQRRTKALSKVVNDAAMAYLKDIGVDVGVWSKYRLIGVQYAPIAGSQNLSSPGGARVPPPGFNDSPYAAQDYYLANPLVETTDRFQTFQGSIPVNNPNVGQDNFGNVAIIGSGNNASSATFVDMGGCMGCHGNTQNGSFPPSPGNNGVDKPNFYTNNRYTDFSFTLSNALLALPDVADTLSADSCDLVAGFYDSSTGICNQSGLDQKCPGGSIDTDGKTLFCNCGTICP